MEKPKNTIPSATLGNPARANGRTALLLILAAGFILRLYQLSGESLYLDEVLTAADSSRPLSAVIHNRVSPDFFPAYFVIMHFWMKLFGSSEFSLRLPAALFGTSSIYVLFLLARKLTGLGTALLACLLFATSAFNIFYSQYARPYSMAVFFVLLSFLFFLKGLEKQNLFSRVGYVFSTLLAWFSTVTTLPVTLCQMLFLLLRGKKGEPQVRSQALLYAVSLLIFLPFLAALIVDIARSGALMSYYRFGKPSLASAAGIFSVFSGTTYYERMIGPLNSLTMSFLNSSAVYLFSLSLLGVFLPGETGEKNMKERLLPSLWLYVPFALALFISLTLFPVFGPARYLLTLSPAYYLLISRGITRIKRKYRAAAALIPVALAIAVSLHSYYRTEKRVPWREISGYISRNIRHNEASGFIITGPASYTVRLMLSYYNVPSLVGIIGSEKAREKWQTEPVFDPKGKGAYNRNTGGMEYELGNLPCEGIWLVTPGNSPPSGKNTPFGEGLSRFRLAGEKSFRDITVFHYTRQEEQKQ